MKQEELELLWKYVDGSCTAAELEMVSKMIADNPIWRDELAAIQAANDMIASNISLQEPSQEFAQQVMSQIKTTPVKKIYINKWIIRGIAAFFIIILTFFLVYAVSHVQYNNTYSFNIPKLSKTFIMILVYTNIIAALIFLDTIIRRKLPTH